MSKSLECKVTADGSASVVAYSIEAAVTSDGDDGRFVIWRNCPNDTSDAARAVMTAARELKSPTVTNKATAVNAFTSHARMTTRQAQALVEAICAAVTTAKQ